MAPLVRRFSAVLAVIILSSPHLYSQVRSEATRKLEEDWKNYTSYQRGELLNFCDFLFEEGHFERSVLACFRFIFLYPDDELVNFVYYRIARSYEESGQLALAIDYFQRVEEDEGPRSSLRQSARHRVAYIRLVGAEYEAVNRMARGTEDPYLMVFDGYAELSRLRWSEARRAFFEAGKRLEADHHRGTLRRLMRACEGASFLPRKKASMAGLLGIFPGGGRLYQEDWDGAAGTLVSVTGLGLQLIFRGSSLFSLWVPGLTVASLYGASVLGSIREVERTNEVLMKRYARGIKTKIGPDLFVDFPEPGSLSSGE